MNLNNTSLIVDLTNEKNLNLFPFWLNHHKEKFNNIIIIVNDIKKFRYKKNCSSYKIVNKKDKLDTFKNKFNLNVTEFLIINNTNQNFNINEIEIKSFKPFSNNKYVFNNNFELFNNLLSNTIKFNKIEINDNIFIIDFNNLINDRRDDNEDDNEEKTKYLYDYLRSKYENKFFIVTGGCGFIGSHLVDKLISLNYKVIVIDNLLSGNIKNLNTNDNVIYENIDINNLELLKTTLEDYDNIDGIFHLAELSNEEICLKDPILCYNTNILGSLNILEIARIKNINKVIISSTNIEEANDNPYKTSKNTIESLALSYINIYKMNITILRYPIVFGKRQTFKNKIEKYKYLGNKIDFSNTNKSYNLLYIDDVINANILSYFNNYNGLLDLYHYEKTTIKEITNYFNSDSNDDNSSELISDSEIDSEIDSELDTDSDTDRESKSDIYVNKAYFEICWKPIIKIKEGIKLIIIDDFITNYDYDDNENIENIGFIILRHVNNEQTNLYWQLCYKSIRKFYPNNKIVIIDDDSNKDYLTSNIKLYKTKIIQSEYPRRGELLPYYYYLKFKFFNNAVILHDSIVINQYINFNVSKYAMLWDIDHDSDDNENDKRIIDAFNSHLLTNFYLNKLSWKGCFGSMTTINFDFLNKINKKFNFSILLDYIKSRRDRCSFERILGCLLQIDDRYSCLISSITNLRIAFRLKFDNINEYNYMPIVKYWTGR
jgi:UDP-glucose 4-epimerase